MRERGDPLDARLARQARNEAQVRDINERIESFDKSFEEQGYSDGLMTFEFHCECGAGEGNAAGCEEQVEMTLKDYEEVRAQNDRFVVRPGHETPELENIVRANRGIRHRRQEAACRTVGRRRPSGGSV